MKNKIFLIPIIVLILFLLFGKNSYSDEGRGVGLFQEKRCIRCHTIGRGKFVGPDLYKVGDKYSEDEILEWIINPQIIYQKLNKMPVNEGYPPMPNLNISHEDAKDITDFLLNNNIKKAVKSGGDIKGKVLNMTKNSAAEGIDVYLQSFIGDKKTGERLSITDKTGRFNFQELKWDNSYSLKIKSEGVEYETAKMVFPPDEDVINLELPIFDASSDDLNIVININHQVIETSNKLLSVAEIYEIENIGNTIYIGEKNTEGDFNKTIKFNIPKEAKKLKFIQGVQGENTIRIGNSVYDTTSFPPGTKRVVFTYELPLNFGNNQIDKDIYYDTKTILVLATESKSNIKVEGLNELDPVFVDNLNYLRWVGENIGPDTKIKINYYSMTLDFKKLELYPIIIFTILFISAVILGFVTIKGKGGVSKYKELIESRQKIIFELAQLDIKHENNEIDSEEYRTFRSELKKSLMLLENLQISSKDPQNKTE